MPAASGIKLHHSEFKKHWERPENVTGYIIIPKGRPVERIQVPCTDFYHMRVYMGSVAVKGRSMHEERATPSKDPVKYLSRLKISV